MLPVYSVLLDVRSLGVRSSLPATMNKPNPASITLAPARHAVSTDAKIVVRP